MLKMTWDLDVRGKSKETMSRNKESTTLITVCVFESSMACIFSNYTVSFEMDPIQQQHSFSGLMVSFAFNTLHFH